MITTFEEWIAWLTNWHKERFAARGETANRLVVEPTRDWRIPREEPAETEEELRQAIAGRCPSCLRSVEAVVKMGHGPDCREH